MIAVFNTKAIQIAAYAIKMGIIYCAAGAFFIITGLQLYLYVMIIVNGIIRRK